MRKIPNLGLFLGLGTRLALLTGIAVRAGRRALRAIALLSVVSKKENQPEWQKGRVCVPFVFLPS
jgi:hypothetical protein